MHTMDEVIYMYISQYLKIETILRDNDNYDLNRLECQDVIGQD